MARNRTQRKTLSGPSILLARHLADRYFRAGVEEYNKFASTLRPDPAAGRLRGLERDAVWPAVVSATLISFAIELNLKVAAAQESGTHLSCHELDVLYGDMVESRRVEIARHYERALEQGLPSVLSIEVALGAALPNREPAGRDDFEEALRQSSSLFVALRYLHEDFEAGLARRVDFHWLFRIHDAVAESIRNFKGDTRASWGSGPGGSEIVQVDLQRDGH